MSLVLRNGRFRLAIGLVILVLGLALVPAASHALAGTPASIAASGTSGTHPQSNANSSKVGPRASGPSMVGKQNPAGKVTSPDNPFNLVLDDGGIENSIGFNDGVNTEDAALW